MGRFLQSLLDEFMATGTLSRCRLASICACSHGNGVQASPVNLKRTYKSRNEQPRTLWHVMRGGWNTEDGDEAENTGDIAEGL
jgi:hypothetical protein